LPVRAIGFVRFRTLAGNPDTPADEADVSITASISDVFDAALADYVGDLRLRTRVRMTDRLNGPTGAETGTVEDFNLNFLVPCAATPDTPGSDCTTVTSADAVVPGFVVEGRRTVWEQGFVQLYDKGADGSIATPDDNLFATQGLFVP
jgi:hypothetical protein